jgi:DnaJ-class molecular chaperone
LENPYTTLGVPRDATPADIHLAFRSLAKLCHPDLYPGEALAKARFIALSAANDVLCHSDQRRRFDREEVAAAVLRRGHWSAEQNQATAGPFGHGAPIPPEIVPTWPLPEKHALLTAEFLDAVNGATIRMTLPDGSRLDVDVPPGTADGEVLRQHRGGLLNWLRGTVGDTLIEVHVKPHLRFIRQGQDIGLDVAVTQAELMFGANIEIVTPGGSVRLHVPAGSANGTRLRLNHRGVPSHHGQATGDLYARLRVVLGTGYPAH